MARPLALCLLCILILVCHSADAAPYVNQKLGFRFEVPKGWKTRPGRPGTAIVVTAVSPKSGPQDRLQENLNVIVEPTSLPLDLYFKKNLTAMRGRFKVVADGKRKDMRWLKFSFKHEGLAIMAVQYTWVRGGRAYLLTFGTAARDHAKYQPLIQKTVGSFKLIR